MSEEQEQPQLFGKYNDFILLFLGFVLTSVIGTAISMKLQNRSWENQERSQRLVDEKSKATEQFENISKMLDSRLYHARRLYWGFTDNFPSEEARKQQLEQRWEKYQEIVFAWNENLNRNISLTQRYFGQRMRANLENEIIGSFVNAGQLLEKQKLRPNNEELKQVDNILKELTSKVFGLNIGMIQLIQVGEVGIFNTEVIEETRRVLGNTNLVVRGK